MSAAAARMPARLRGRGFTLIELLLVVGVLALLTSLAVPSFADQRDRQRLQTAAEALAADLFEARFDAAQRGQRLHVSFVGGTDWCYALSTAPGCDCRGTAACRVRTARGSEWPGIGLADSHDAVIDPSGIGAATTVASFVSPRGETLRVVLSPLGRPRVCTPDGAGRRYTPC